MTLRKLSLKRLLSGQKYTIKRSKIKPKKRSAKDYARIYGSRARVEFVKSLECSACRVQGYSQNAHVAPAREKGTGYKAGYEWIVPLCGPHPDNDNFGLDQGCHLLHDILPNTFDERFPDFDPQKAAQATEQAWQEFASANRSLVPTKEKK